MSILIKGIEMPKDDEILCIDIKSNGDVYYNLDLSVNIIANAIRIPPHGRLIDAEELMRSLGITDMDCEKCKWSNHTLDCTRGTDFFDACCAIDYAPTVIPTDKEDQ